MGCECGCVLCVGVCGVCVGVVCVCNIYEDPHIRNLNSKPDNIITQCVIGELSALFRMCKKIKQTKLILYTASVC